MTAQTAPQPIGTETQLFDNMIRRALDRMERVFQYLLQGDYERARIPYEEVRTAFDFMRHVMPSPAHREHLDSLHRQLNGYGLLSLIDPHDIDAFINTLDSYLTDSEETLNRMKTQQIAVEVEQDASLSEPEITAQTDAIAPAVGTEVGNSLRPGDYILDFYGEYADNILKGRDCRDDIGDIVITLILQCEMQKTTITECLQLAFDEINNRVVRMENGSFIKETDEA